MHPYLTRLGIRPEVQEFFAPFYSADSVGNLCFRYGEELEHFGFAFHRVPVSADFWLAGNLNLSQVRQVIISASALDGVSWLNKKAAFLSHTENLLFLSTGAGVNDQHIRWINMHLQNKECCLINGRDLPGAMADLKLSAAIRRVPLAVYFADGRISVSFRLRTFSFSPETFSLSAFEKSSGFRFGIRTEKPKEHLTYFDELKAEAFFTF
jgi:hypothetical protein